MKRLTTVLVGLVTVFALLTGGVAGADVSSSNLGGSTKSDTCGVHCTIHGTGTYSGHSHASARIDVTLQRFAGGAYQDVAATHLYKYFTTSSTSLTTALTCYTEVILTSYRVKVRVRTYGPGGALTGDATVFKGQNSYYVRTNSCVGP